MQGISDKCRRIWIWGAFFTGAIFLLMAGCTALTPSLPPENQPTETAETIPSEPTTGIPTPTASFTIEPPTATPTPEPTPEPSQTPTPTHTPVPVIHMVFTGQIVPARCVQAGIDATGNPDAIYDAVREILVNADLTIGALNATMSDRSSMTGCIPTFVLVGRPDNAGAMARAGFDVMSVATNHIKNCNSPTCGEQAFLDTLDYLREAGIYPVGAGLNLAEGMAPVVIEIQGIKFGFVSLGQIEPNAFAGDNTPGIAVLNEDNLRTSIAAARQVSDVVIVLPHWGPEYSPDPNYLQLGLAKVAVEAGADLVVGNHTHVIQTWEIIDGVYVFYGLGNFIFDQSWSEETRQSVILTVTFEGTRPAGFQFTPVITDIFGITSLLEDAQAAQILNRFPPLPQP